MVEFALIAPAFFLMLFGIIELGRLMWIDHTMANVTREGARLALVSGSKSDDPASAGEIADLVESKAIGVDNVAVTVTGLGGDPGDTVTVTTTADFQFITSMIAGVSSITLTHTSEVIIQH